jgi:HEAT repeat protein
MRWLKRQQFNSKDPEIREATLRDLSAKAGPKDIRLFARGLLDEHKDVRRAANRAIDMISPSASAQCIKMLLPLLRNQDFTVRKGAVLALQTLNWDPETPENHTLCQIALGNFNDVVADPAAVKPLLDALRTGSIPIKVGAAQALEQIQRQIQDPQIVKPLIDALKNSEANLRAAAVHALGNSNDEQRVAPLLKAFKDSVAFVRAAAAQAIGKTENAEFLPHFAPLLKDENFEVRIAAVT